MFIALVGIVATENGGVLGYL